MRRMLSHSGRAAALAALLVITSGCRNNQTNRTSLNLTVNGRAVSAVIDGSASISSEGDIVFIQFEGHTLAVLKDRILLDREEKATLPASARTVKITYTGGRLTALADGTSIDIPIK